MHTKVSLHKSDEEVLKLWENTKFQNRKSQHVVDIIVHIRGKKTGISKYKITTPRKQRLMQHQQRQQQEQERLDDIRRNEKLEN